jgi:aconitate hydratase
VTPHAVKVKAGSTEFEAVVRIDTPGEADYYRNGGILPFVLRQLI